ncbi:MAG TPA: hypothetical protein VGI85_09560 [Chthoniobacterales bacterium]
MNRHHLRFFSLLLGPLLAFGFSLGYATTAAAQNEKASIQEEMSPEQFKAAGLEKLTPAELEKLNRWLQGDREKIEEKAASKAVKHEKLHLIVSRVDGVVQGISTRQIIPLEDGSQWEITDRTPRYDGPPKDHPATAVYKTFFGWKIRMAGVGEYYVVPVGKQ